MGKTKSSDPRGLYLRGNVYYCRLTGADGKLIRSRLSEDKATAIILLAEKRKQIELQKVGILPENLGEEIKDCASIKQLYVDRLRSHGRTEATIKAFSLSWKYVIEQQGFTMLHHITVAKVQDFCERLKAKGTTGQTINHYVGFVKDAFDWARDFEYIRHNPLARWELVKRDAPRKRRDMTPEEIERFFAAEDDPEFRLRWMIYFHTGLRATAGMNVEWGWILWDRQSLMLPAKANKSGRDHWIPLDVVLFSELKERRDGLPEGAAVGRIFPSLTTAQVRMRFRKVCLKAGIDLDGLCLHSIRHTYATGSFEASGFNVKVVQKLLGHADAATTMKYIHTSEQEMREVNDEVASRLHRPKLLKQA